MAAPQGQRLWHRASIRPPLALQVHCCRGPSQPCEAHPFLSAPGPRPRETRLCGRARVSPVCLPLHPLPLPLSLGGGEWREPLSVDSSCRGALFLSFGWVACCQRAWLGPCLGFHVLLLFPTLPLIEGPPGVGRVLSICYPVADLGTDPALLATACAKLSGTQAL